MNCPKSSFSWHLRQTLFISLVRYRPSSAREEERQGNASRPPPPNGALGRSNCEFSSGNPTPSANCNGKYPLTVGTAMHKVIGGIGVNKKELVTRRKLPKPQLPPGKIGRAHV